MLSRLVPDSFVFNDRDPGGSTKFGISLRALRELPVEVLRKCGLFEEPASLTVDHLRDLTTEQALIIFKSLDENDFPLLDRR